MDNTTLTYTSIQRVFRNAIVGYLRQRLSVAFGPESLSRLRKPFKSEEWARMRAGSDEPRSLGNVTNQLVDDFDLLSVNHFFNLFDAYWDVLKPSGGAIGANSEATKRGLLGFLRDVKVVRDPISHPGEADLPREDAFRVIDSARRVLSMLGLREHGMGVYAASRNHLVVPCLGNYRDCTPIAAKVGSIARRIVPTAAG